MTDVRPFARHDRDGLTALANRHIAAVVPGAAIPVATLLSQMERDTHEPVVDPWVIDRHTLVALERDIVVAAAHLKRYGAHGHVSASYRDVADIDWLLCDPRAVDAGRDLVDAATRHLRGWSARRWGADGNLPCLGVYGIPDTWPHVQELLMQAGFTDHGGQIEVVLVGDLAQLSPPGPPPVDGLELRRVAGPLGTLFQAVLRGVVIGAFEVEDSHGTTNGSLSRWADVANHHVLPGHRGRGVGPWLVHHGCEWLRLGGKDRLLAYATERWGADAVPTEGAVEDWTRYFERFGLRQITRTRRGWHRAP